MTIFTFLTDAAAAINRFYLRQTAMAVSLGLALASGMATGAVADTEPEPVHGIAMHGEPKYPADFPHLDYVDPDAPKGGELRHAATGSYDTLNPHNIRGTAAQGLEMVYEPLMARVWDEPFSLYGLIAETVRVPEDRSWIEFRLREEARFHDGTPVTVDDVVFSFETLRDQGRPNARRIYGLVDRVERPTEGTVRFVLGPGHDRETVMILAMMPVLPEHYWEERDFGRTTLEPPLGSGPYRIARHEQGRFIAYERVEDYWGRDLPINVGKHNFDQVRTDYYRDESVSLEAFKAGEYNFRREWDARRWDSGYDGPAISDGRITMELLEHQRPEWMRALIFNTRNELFADRRVRRALNLAFDFEWMNRALFADQFERIDSYFVNSELAHQGPPGEAELELLEPHREHLWPDVFERAYEPPQTDGSGQRGLRENLREATSLLSDAGWSVSNGTLAHEESGRQFQFEILLQDPNDERVALEFSRTLERLGIQATVRTVDSAQYQGRLDEFDFDMTLNRWISTLSPGNEQLFYWGSDAADQPGSRNYAGIRNPAVDALAAAIAEAEDRESLVARVHALDRVLSWGHYVIPLYYLGADRVAYWEPLARPDVTPIYGLVIETWWSEPQ